MGDVAPWIVHAIGQNAPRGRLAPTLMGAIAAWRQKSYILMGGVRTCFEFHDEKHGQTLAKHTKNTCSFKWAWPPMLYEPRKPQIRKKTLNKPYSMS